MELKAINDKAKCEGIMCDSKNRCGRYLRQTGDRQVWSEFWRAGDRCQFYETVPSDAWDEKRIDLIGQNGNDGLHYEN